MKKLLVFCCVILLCNCNKKKKEAFEEQAKSEPPIQNTELKSGIGPHHNQVHGFFMLEKSQYQDVQFSTFSALASFDVKGKTVHAYLSRGIFANYLGHNAGVVKVDTTTLSFYRMTNETTGMYQDTTDNLTTSTKPIWNVSGNTSFPAFKVDAQRPFPDSPLSADTLKKSAGYQIKMGTCDSIVVILAASSGGSQAFQLVKHFKGSGAVFIPVSDLQNFPGNSATLMVFAMNFSNQMIAGKNYVFLLQNLAIKSLLVQ